MTITTGEDVIRITHAAPQQTSAVVIRGDEEEALTLPLQLDGNPRTIGIVWRVDEGNDSTLVLSRVDSFSAAADAGLAKGDRIYQLDGKPITSEAEFVKSLKANPEELTLQMERAGLMKSAHNQTIASA